MDFVQKSNFSYLHFSQKSHQKRSFLILCKEKNDFKQEKLKFLKGSKNRHFLKGLVRGVLSKNRTFSYRSFLQKLCQKTPFLDVLNRKQSFLDQKIEILTRTKKWTFFKGVSPWILFKNRTFSFLLFSQKFYQKTAFLILWKEKNDVKWKKFKFKKGP